MAVKKRVFQVAREFNISNEALIAFLTGLNYDIRNHMSPLTDEAYQQAEEKYREKSVPEKVDEEYEFRKKLRDKQAIEQKKTLEAKENLERRIRFARELAEEKPKLQQKRAAVVTPEVKPAEEKKIEQLPVVPEQEQVKSKRPRKKLRIVEIPPEATETRAKPKEEVKPETTKPFRKREKPKKPHHVEEAVTKEKAEGKAVFGEETETHRRKKRKEYVKLKGAEKEKISDEKGLALKKKSKRKKKRKPVFDEEEIQENIRQTLASIEDTARSKKKRRRVQVDSEEMVEEIPVIRVSEFMSLNELAKLMDIEASEVIKKSMEQGMMVSINQRLDMDSITLLASEYGYEIEALSEFGEDILELMDEKDDEKSLSSRPPVVTIMGHVDHGKTSLLDYFRKSNIIAGESGGITQHIGAYEVKLDGKAVTFLDTPGHEAFTAMRARGAQVTDIVILVVAADDNVRPQTIEAISHAKAAGVPIIVAINKIDKPNANPDIIRKQLSEHNVLVEQWGGKYQSVEISAKTGQAVDQLLEMILLEAEILDLKANPDRKAKGVVIESRLDKGKGVVSSVLVQNGTLHTGDPFIAGSYSGKVRSMLDERGKRVKSAGPSVPVQVLGCDGLPQAGDSFLVLDTEKDTKEISQKRQLLNREHEHWRNRPRTLDEISKQIKKGQVQQLSVVIKADVDGSIEAITDSLLKLSTDEVSVNVIHKNVGAISESDVLLASASGAIIIGFNVRPTTKARELAGREKVDIRSYEVIYDILDDVKSALEGFLEPTITEEIVGTVEVRQTFKVPKIGTIAGCYVVSGKVNRNNKIKLYRDDRLVHDGKISSLKRFKEDTKEVNAGFECGIGVEGYDDIKVNDIIEIYELKETKRSL
ncbi:translation initiation factor IF-2 [candidate division KSB1 bacterium]|nr:translation initiation factor IF-2 [candidate division KSB1 bacterium]